ncbi:MAG TPA: hypothetical protein VJZ00_24230 [Thermoanaerobaculia bacterium]|nr:hypothetical protein [Thermoanaerobaculia bacterium]
MRRLLVFLALAFALAAQSQTTTKNDDSCDIMVAPAATLLLPYFEVDLSHQKTTTIFTVTNVGAMPQIAHVTLWTDEAFPVFAFDIFLTGYDVQEINMFDLVSRGRIAEPGTSSYVDVGRRSSETNENPLLDVTNCKELPVRIPDAMLVEIQAALTRGRSTRCPLGAEVGGRHTHALGYVTVDVVARCGTGFPTDAGYASQALLYDNILSGDYEQVDWEDGSSQRSPMVHIRAFPEGGAPGAKTTNLTRTFYSNLQSGGATADRRQPLPSLFAARWISGTQRTFTTKYNIWREWPARADACHGGPNTSLPVAEFVRFDEDENPTTYAFPFARPLLPATSNVDVSDGTRFPPRNGLSVAGWMYMNLDNGVVESPVDVASQNWVTTTMSAEGRYSVAMDASALGNGCSGIAPHSDVAAPIGPAPDRRATFASGSPATTGNDDSCDVVNMPAATLLLPYFEVDLRAPVYETTLFTVTNVTRVPQIAHVTLWSDWSFPVLSFDVFLTGYDVQAIDLYDVIARGRLPRTRSADPRNRSANEEDRGANFFECNRPLGILPANVRDEVQRALTTGRTTSCGNARVGAAHTSAKGFVTVDVVQHCGSGFPTDPDYFTRTALYDNVLIGDYQQINSSRSSAQGNPMVHIRAIPEGGPPGSGTTKFTRTFYARLQKGATADRRQPLPSTFAARWISNPWRPLETTFKIWREAKPANTGCAVAPNGEHRFIEIVRFDEEENPSTFIPAVIFDPFPLPQVFLPSSARLNARDEIVPPNPDFAVSGWLYMNLDNREVGQPAPTQAWVTVSMSADGRYAGDFDALALGNGCSAAVAVTDSDRRAPAIGPSVP